MYDRAGFGCTRPAIYVVSQFNLTLRLRECIWKFYAFDPYTFHRLESVYYVQLSSLTQHI